MDRLSPHEKIALMVVKLAARKYALSQPDKVEEDRIMDAIRTVNAMLDND